MSKLDLTEMSNRYGSDERYILAGGGNTSFKENGVMYVKGSGTSLATIGPEDFVAMDMAKLEDILSKTYSGSDEAREDEAQTDIMAARLPGEEHKRPSVEAILHIIFPQKYVLHIHPTMLNGLSCSRDGEAKCREMFGDGAVWIPRERPGYILAESCAKRFAVHEKTTGKPMSLAILQNHGIFAAADTVEGIDAIMNRVDTALAAAIKEVPDLSPVEADTRLACEIAPALRMLYMRFAGTGTASVVFFTNRMAVGFASSLEDMQALMEPFSPDHVVYCKGKPLFFRPDCDLEAEFGAFVRENGYAPVIAAVEGLGFFALGKTKRDAGFTKLLCLDAMKIAVYARSFGGPQGMPDRITDFMINWEVENYRRKVGVIETRGKRLDGKIAVVTGSAQGFGKGIAEAMAAQGAHVVVADLNAGGAKACADALCAAHGPDAAIPVKANVADEDSVRTMIEAAVLNYGGLDIFVSNAGIAIAGSLAEMTREKFDLVTAVNYTGYFLCAKYASVPMKIQRRYNPGYLMDIIEINSKSGLEGSNKNFAYAGSKFGGVGLTQSFALELVKFGIKVNAICPGNLLDGPLWSDPEKGLFRQYFEAGKIPGAKSVEDVRRFYESKVPMNRGCTVEDVACALLYVVEQKYETGQALPVTGGQIMLK